MLKLIALGLKRFRSVEHYRALQAYLANGTLAEIEARGIKLAECDFLELAAGPGGYSTLFAQKARTFVANDLKPDIFFRKNKIPFVAFDVCAGFPFATGSFDLIYCSSLIEHLEEPLPMLSECRRVVRPAGHLFLSFPPFYSLAMVGGHQFKPFHLLGERLAVRLHNWLRTDDVQSYATCFGAFGLYPLTIDRVANLISEAGFEITGTYTRMSPINTSRLPGILKDLATWHVCYLAQPSPD